MLSWRRACVLVALVCVLTTARAFDEDILDEEFATPSPALDSYMGDDLQTFTTDFSDIDDEGSADDAFKMRFASLAQVPNDANATTNATANATAPSTPVVTTSAPAPVTPPAPVNNTVENDPFKNKYPPLDTEHNGIQYGPPQLLPEDLDLPARCISWGYPQSMITFDSNRFRFDGHGEFIMYRQFDERAVSAQKWDHRFEEVRTLQRRAGKASFTYGVSFQNFDDVAILWLESTGNGDIDLSAMVNGAKVDYARIPAVASFTFMDQGSIKGNNKIVSVRNGDGTRLAVTVHRYNELTHLNIFLQVPGQKWNATQGLCGTFDLNPNNEMQDADGAALNNAQSFAAAWGQNSANSTVFPLSIFTADLNQTVLLDTPTKLSDLAANPQDISNARRVCASFDLTERKDCMRNVLVNGLNIVEEVASVNIIANEGIIVPDAAGAKCVQQPFSMSDWTKFGDCSVTCGQGTQNRSRSLLVNGTTECGKLYQMRSCDQQCEHVRVWGKCAAYGDVHIVTFDRDMYDYQGTGEYIFFQHALHQEQINIMTYRPNPTSVVSFVSGAAFKFGADVFSVQLLAPTYDRPVFRFNAEYIDLVSQRAVYGFFSVSQTGQFGSSTDPYIVELKIPGGTRLTINFQNFNKVNQLTVYVEVGGAKINEGEGLCGNFDFNSTNDRVLRGTTQVNYNTTEVGWSYNIFANASLFTDTFPLPQKPVYDYVNAANVTRTPVEELKNVRAVCMDVPHAFQRACRLDVVVGGLQAIRGIREVEAIIGDHMYSAEPSSIPCLKATGTTLGAPTQWSKECSTKCGPGVLTRDYRIRLANFTDCGVLTQSKYCEVQPCPVDCTMGEWAPWGTCSKECGSGIQTRNRTVIRRERNGGLPCKHEQETQQCKMRDCCQMTEWTGWGSCQSGVMTRMRDLVTGDNSTCGPLREVKACCDVSQWSDWSPCRRGFRHRRRNVVGLPTCGHKVEREACCEVGQWSDFSACKDGEQVRTRDVIGAQSCGVSLEKRPCCEVGEWSDWSECENGTQIRARTVIGGPTCAGQYPRYAKRECCYVGNWSDWTECNVGFQERSRLVVGKPACGVPNEKRECCFLSQWSDWDNCVDGKQSRRRIVTGKAACGKSEETQVCCDVQEWSAWTSCLADGYRHRNRTVKGYERCHWEHPKEQLEACCSVGPWSAWNACNPGEPRLRTRVIQAGNEQCKAETATSESRPCCGVGDWSEWEKCRPDGKTSRHREIDAGSPDCFKAHPNVETKPCCLVGRWGAWTGCQDGYDRRNRVISGHVTCLGSYNPVEQKPCCSYGNWTEWSNCVEGTMYRTRGVDGPNTCGVTREDKRCCEYSEWSDWGPCTKGVITRRRAVLSADRCAGVARGLLYQQKACCLVDDWGQWSQCTGDGYTHRLRNVTGHARCDMEMPSMQTRRCCYVGPWGDWSECVGGIRRRERRVGGEDSCIAQNARIESEQCCTVGPWGSFGSCINGTVTRTRTITGNCSATKPEAVENRKCCVVGPWVSSGCAGTGVVTRTRVVSGHAECLKDYPTTETVNCAGERVVPPPTNVTATQVVGVVSSSVTQAAPVRFRSVTNAVPLPPIAPEVEELPSTSHKKLSAEDDDDGDAGDADDDGDEDGGDGEDDDGEEMFYFL